MSARPWEEEAERLLKRTFALLEAGSNLSSRAGLLQIAPALTGEEAKHFVLGLESGLFEIDEQGCSRDSFGSASRVGGDASPLRVFSEDGSRLVREAVCQLSTAAALVLDRGWLPR